MGPTASSIHMELVGPITPSQGYTHILTITDAFTQYTELIPISNKQTTTVAKALLDEWMLRHGFYEQVVSDHGGEFVSDVIIRLNEIIKMRHHGRMETAHINQIRDNLPPPIDRYTSANQNLAIAT